MSKAALQAALLSLVEAADYPAALAGGHAIQALTDAIGSAVWDNAPTGSPTGGTRVDRSTSALWYKCTRSPIPNDGAGGSLDLTLDAGNSIKSAYSTFQTAGVNDAALLLAASNLRAVSAGSQPTITGAACHIGCWFKTFTTGSYSAPPCVFGLASTGGIGKLAIGLYATGLAVLYRTTGGTNTWLYSATGPLSPGVTYLAVATFDGQYLRAYLNGVLVASVNLGAGTVLDTAVAADVWRIGYIDVSYVPSPVALVYEAFAASGTPSEATIESWYRAGVPNG